jgi:hypothetical protein
MTQTEGGDPVAQITPKELAAKLEVDPKRLRAFLRANFTRPAEAKNTSWSIGPDAVKAATEHFAKSETA